MRTALCLLLLSACADLPFFSQDAGSGPPPLEDPCSPAPGNGDREHALEMTLEVPLQTKYCVGAQRYGWWKIPGNYPDHTRYRLFVEFTRGRAASDLDFELVPSTGGVDQRRSVISGSCRNPAGQNEDCTVEINPGATPADTLLVGLTPGNGAQSENFRLTVTAVR